MHSVCQHIKWNKQGPVRERKWGLLGIMQPYADMQSWACGQREDSGRAFKVMGRIYEKFLRFESIEAL